MMNEKQALGKWGEIEAIKLLKEHGLEVIEANWTFLHLEIDIVAKDGDTLVVVEVKTRSTDAYGDPEMFVSRAKQKKLIRAANWYLQNKKLNNEVRFDVVGIVQGFDGIKTSYVKGAFSPIG
jgi:putative endonuclease